MDYAIIGEKLSHSFSKEIYTKYFGLDYGVKELQLEEVGPLLQKREFKGINVTIPYKQTVIPYLDEISDVAKKIGAVNVIVNDNGKLKGYNTDILGLKANIENVGINLKDKDVLILGDGATSKNAYAVAEMCGAKTINKVSRENKTDTITYEQAKEMKNTQVIINTTPVGMYPKIEGCLVDLNCFPALEGVFDAVYNPLCPKLVVEAKKRGITACGGLYMLISQAVFAVEKFKNLPYSQSKTNDIFKEIYKSKENIVLVGMPGSGKTTVGKLLAEQLGREFIDTDEIIANEYGNITEIFETRGEGEFRNIETCVIKQVSALQGKVIATGGGAVLKQENIDLLRLNGKIYFLDRPLESLVATDDRPLSNDSEKLENLYNQRYKIYLNCCDKQIISNNTPSDTVLSVKEDWLK
ncbi:MAG: shikimate dehydrogenase [Ruminococcaceae bacterium]|nr:shikimate dehydrogenase [Oscillospiraceae bacterium]